MIFLTVVALLMAAFCLYCVVCSGEELDEIEQREAFIKAMKSVSDD
jgi:hypothetical protein